MAAKTQPQTLPTLQKKLALVKETQQKLSHSRHSAKRSDREKIDKEIHQTKKDISQ